MKLPGNLGELMEKAMQLQGNVQEMQKELEKKTVQASAGGGMVTATVNGALEVVAVEIDPTVVDPNDIAMLQDLVKAAVNEAARKAKDMLKEEMAKLTGGLPIPGFPS